MLLAPAFEAPGPASRAAYRPPQLELHVKPVPGNEDGHKGGEIPQFCPGLLEKALPSGSSYRA